MTVKVSASILAADFANLGKEVRAVDRAGVDFIHLDIMDGHFVENISFGVEVIKAIRPYTNKIFDTHMMIDDVEKYAKTFIKAGVNLITFHAEHSGKTTEIIDLLKSYGCKVGIAIKPDTNPAKLKKFLKDIDLILVMSVEPGFAGQCYVPQEEKVREIAKMVKNYDIEIEVDGGINDQNALNLIKAGATILVSGSYIFKSKNYKKAIKSLKG